MNLRNRALLSLGITFFIFFLVIAVVSLSVTLQGLDRLEYQDMGKSINQTHAAIDSEAATLLITVHDWAWWDATASFTMDRNARYIEENANPDSMRNLRIHFFVILDDQGNVLYNSLLSPDFSEDIESPEEYLALARAPGFTGYGADDSGASGLLQTPGGPMIIASSPILQSDMSGPVRGTVIMGRYLDYGPIQRINEITGFSVLITSLKTVPDQVQKELDTGAGFVVSAANEREITGYSRFRDLAGKSLILRVTSERVLYRTGFANIVTYLALLGLWAVMLGFIVLVVIDRTVLQRVAALTDNVRTFAAKKGDVPAPVLRGDDELAALEKIIIASREDLLLSEQQLRTFINAMPGPAALFTRGGKINILNPAFERIIGRPMEEVAGSDIRTFFPPAEAEKYERFVQEAIAKKEAAHFETTSEGRTILMSFYPVLDHAGEVIQLGYLTFDISERKRLENALQKVTKKIALLNTVIFQDIQNKVFVQMGFLELARHMQADPQLKRYLEKEEEVVRDIQSSLRFAKQYNDMGITPPRWQSVQDVMLFAISHLDLGSIRRDFSLEGLEIFADALLERVLVTIVENTIIHAEGASQIRAGYTVTGDDAVIFVEDNGPGIPAERKEEIFQKGVGTSGSANLFLSREILSITGIAIRETGDFGKGARFEIQVPKGSYRFTGK